MSKKLSPVNIGKRGGGSLVNLLALAILSVFSSTAFGQVWIDGRFYPTGSGSYGQYDNFDQVGVVEIVSSGQLWNRSGASITTANVSDSGFLRNADGQHRGTASIGTANIRNNGAVINDEGNTIGTANVYNNGTLLNSNGSSSGVYSKIGTVNVNGSGRLYNDFGARIDTVYVYGNGQINNLGAAGISSVFLNGGAVNNVSLIDNLTYTGGTYSGRWAEQWYSPSSPVFTATGNGRIGNLTVASNSSGIDWGIVANLNIQSSGRVENFTMGIISSYLSGTTVANGGYIDNLTYAGWGTYNGMYSGSNGTIGTLNVTRNSTDIDWGNVTNLNNQSSGTVGTFTMKAGNTVTNAGTINNLTYNGGTYTQSGNGNIGTLTLASGSANNPGDWGTVDNLRFSSNGNGMLSISAFADESPAPSGIQATQSVDFAYGNISLDMSDFGYGDDLVGSFFNAFGFDNGFFLDTFLGDMLGVSNVSGAERLASFEVAFGGLDSFWIINDGVFGDDWTYNSDTGFVAFGTGGGDVVPEPATLAILGLGLAGLGLARRRRKP